MKEIRTSAIIALKDECNILYKISRIDYTFFENEEYEYVFTPFYNVIDFLPINIFQGIPGLDLSLRRKQYIRKNMVPCFISERTPGENREDLQELLESCGMKTLNRLEWLTKTDLQYFGDNMFAIPLEGNEPKTYNVNSMFELVKPLEDIHYVLLSIICGGDNLNSKEITIDASSRATLYRLLKPIYEHELEKKKKARKEGIDKAKEEGVYKGRSKKKIDYLLLEELINEYHLNLISIDEMATKLKISRSTLFRRLKERNNKTQFK